MTRIFTHTLLGMRTIALIAVLATAVCGCGGGGGAGGGSANHDPYSARITLQQGEFVVREQPLEQDTRFRIEGCPEDVCSTELIDWDSPQFRVAIKYFTTSATPAGTYDISLISYLGGESCAFFGGCSTQPEEILQRWQVQLEVVAGGYVFERVLPYTVTGQVESVAVVDMNGDARPDVVTLSSGVHPAQSSLSVYLTQAAGGLELQVVVPVFEERATDFLAADFDNDGTTDLLVTYSNGLAVPAGIIVFRGLGNGDYEPGVSQPIVNAAFEPWNARYPQFVDIDGDGAREIVVAVQWREANSGGGVVVLKHLNDEYVATQFLDANEKNLVRAVEIVDVNQDQLLDLVVLVDTPSGSALEIYAGSITAEFSPSPLHMETLAGRAYSMLTADLNNDSLIDIVTAQRQKVVARLGRGGGMFEEPYSISVGSDIRALGWADMNGDGLVDVVTGNVSPFKLHQPSVSSASVLEGDGVGGFARPSAVAMDSPLHDLALADFNGDDRVDLVLVHGGIDQLTQFSQ